MGSETKEKLLQLSQATDEASTALQTSLALIQSREDEVSSLGQQMTTLAAKLAEVGGINKKLQDQFDRIEEQDMPAEQLQTIAMLQKQIECLEDKVFDRDAALQEIESQMKQDYEQHDQLIGKLKSQVGGLLCVCVCVLLLLLHALINATCAGNRYRTFGY